MCKDNIENLKRAIKRTHERLIGKKTDKKVTLKDLAIFFNISIDEERLEDYRINKINYEVPSIELIDTKTNTSYNATYTDRADL